MSNLGQRILILCPNVSVNVNVISMSRIGSVRLNWGVAPKVGNHVLHRLMAKKGFILKLFNVRFAVELFKKCFFHTSVRT